VSGSQRVVPVLMGRPGDALQAWRRPGVIRDTDELARM
jgi:hypothetical protein